MTAGGPARRRGGWLAAGALAAVLAVPVSGCTGGAGAADGPADGAAGRHAEVTANPARLAPCPAATGQSNGSPALPDLTLPCLGGERAVPLRRLAGTPTVLNLWASWCAPCRAELPAFQQAYEAAGGRLRVLGVVTEDSPAKALSLAADAGVHFASVLDETGKLRRALGRSGLPATVLVAADGRVARVYAGPPLRYDDLRALVRTEFGLALA